MSIILIFWVISFFLSLLMREILTIYFLSFSLSFNLSNQSESNCSLMAIGLHLAATSNLEIGITWEVRFDRAYSWFSTRSHLARNPTAISRCITRARCMQPPRRKSGRARLRRENRADRSNRSFGRGEKIYARSSAREEITFVRTNYPSARGIETSVRSHVCDLH